MCAYECVCFGMHIFIWMVGNLKLFSWNEKMNDFFFRKLMRAYLWEFERASGVCMWQSASNISTYRAQRKNLNTTFEEDNKLNIYNCFESRPCTFTESWPSIWIKEWMKKQLLFMLPSNPLTILAVFHLNIKSDNKRESGEMNLFSIFCTKNDDCGKQLLGQCLNGFANWYTVWQKKNIWKHHIANVSWHSWNELFISFLTEWEFIYYASVQKSIEMWQQSLLSITNVSAKFRILKMLYKFMYGSKNVIQIHIHHFTYIKMVIFVILKEKNNFVVFIGKRRELLAHLYVHYIFRIVGALISARWL